MPTLIEKVNISEGTNLDIVNQVDEGPFEFKEANRNNVTLADTELVVPVPVYALEEMLKFYIRVNEGFTTLFS